MSYKEPAPIMHEKDPLESMMKRFHVAAEHLNLDEEVYDVLKSSVKKIIVSLPISMDDGSINCLLYTSPSPRDGLLSRMPSSA